MRLVLGRIAIVAFGALGLTPCPALAQWTFQSLGLGVASDIHGDQVVGWQNSRAALWSSTTGMMTDLHPATPWPLSYASGTSGAQQVGSVYDIEPIFGATFGEAAIWDGTASSFVSLHPVNGGDSSASAAAGNTQVGTVNSHASLWHGTAASWVDLHPDGASWSRAVATTGVRQGGFAMFGDQLRAGSWAGTAASWVNLHPQGLAHSSVVNAVTSTHEGGFTRAVSDGPYHAALWSGSAASWVSLHPPSMINSVVDAMTADLQVGGTEAELGLRSAALWRGSMASWVDLGALTPGFYETSATGVWTDGVTIRVVGWGTRKWGGPEEALLWTSTVPSPSTTWVAGLLGLAMCRRRVRPQGGAERGRLLPGGHARRVGI